MPVSLTRPCFFFVSFILVATFVVINVFIGIVLNSMEEARELERMLLFVWQTDNEPRVRDGYISVSARGHARALATH